MQRLEDFLPYNKNFTPIYIRLNNKLIASAYTSEQVDMLITVLSDNLLSTTNTPIQSMLKGRCSLCT